MVSVMGGYRRVALLFAVALALGLALGLAAHASSAAAAQRYQVYANIDTGGGVLLANEPGGYYMGRLFPGRGFPGSAFDRQEAWYESQSNQSDYAWSFAWGSGANYCFWVGPSRGVIGVHAGSWATPTGTVADRCTGTQKSDLTNRATFGSAFNCPAGAAQGGTQKTVTAGAGAPFYYNIQWNGGYGGGAFTDQNGTIPYGSSIWYRYTTRDGRAWVVETSDRGWGFVPAGVASLSQNAGYWSRPWEGATAHTC